MGRKAVKDVDPFLNHTVPVFVLVAVIDCRPLIGDRSGLSFELNHLWKV
jgi:hypothetical protein